MLQSNKRGHNVYAVGVNFMYMSMQVMGSVLNYRLVMHTYSSIVPEGTWPEYGHLDGYSAHIPTSPTNGHCQAKT